VSITILVDSPYPVNKILFLKAEKLTMIRQAASRGRVYSVGMRDDTRIDWHRRVDEALIRLLDKLDDPPRYARPAAERILQVALLAAPGHNGDILGTRTT
jgi:hypothetical protein